MKKKLLTIALLLVMCFSVIGCDKTKTDDTTTPDQEKETEKEEQKETEEQKELDLTTLEGYFGRYGLTEAEMKPSNADEMYVSGDYAIVIAKEGTGDKNYETYINQCITALKKVSKNGVKNTLGETATSKDDTLQFSIDGTNTITLHIAHQGDIYQMSFSE